MQMSNGNAHHEQNSIKQVEVFIQFCRIGEIDTIHEVYQSEVLIEAKWIEKEEITVYDAKKHWNPKLEIENALQISREHIEYGVVRDTDRQYTIITEIRLIKGTFWERLELHHFPFDLQELSISVVSKLNSNEVKLNLDDKKLSFINLDATNTFIDQQEWRLFKLVKFSNIASYDSRSSISTINTINEAKQIFQRRFHTERSKIVATCFCSRKPGYYIFNAYFLIFLITTTALTIFSVDCKLPQNRLQINFLILLTSVSFKWIINRSLPTISYLTILDTYSIICIFYVCLLGVWHSIIGHFWADNAQRLDFFMLVFFSLLLLLINVCVFIWCCIGYAKIRKMKCNEAKFLKMLKDNFDKMNSEIDYIEFKI